MRLLTEIGHESPRLCKRGMKGPPPAGGTTCIFFSCLFFLTICANLYQTSQKARRSLSWPFAQQRLDAGASREREPAQRAKEAASAAEAQICMRARVRRLERPGRPTQEPLCPASGERKRGRNARNPVHL